MTVALVATVALAVLVGLALGLLGGGGSILTVPILVYVAGVDAREAIAMSLLVVAVTSMAGLVPHARAGRVQWRTGLLFGGVGMLGAYGGGRLAGHLPDRWLLIAFALVMAAAAVAMLRGRPTTAPRHARMPVGHIVAEGLLVGVVTGLVGAGGGFLVVPALVLFGGMAMPTAVGTSLVVIAMKSVAGLAGHLASTAIDWPLAVAVTAAAVAGSALGARLVHRIAPNMLQRGFAWFVAVMAAVMLGLETPGWWWRAAGVPLVLLGIAGLVAGVVRCRRSHSTMCARVVGARRRQGA